FRTGEHLGRCGVEGDLAAGAEAGEIDDADGAGVLVGDEAVSEEALGFGPGAGRGGDGRDEQGAPRNQGRVHYAILSRGGVKGAPHVILEKARQSTRRRGGRVVEGARLKSVFRRNPNGGSNPTLSAITKSISYRNKPVSACNSVQRCVAIRSKSSLTQARRVRGGPLCRSTAVSAADRSEKPQVGQTRFAQSPSARDSERSSARQGLRKARTKLPIPAAQPRRLQEAWSQPAREGSMPTNAPANPYQQFSRLPRPPECQLRREGICQAAYR